MEANEEKEHNSATPANNNSNEVLIVLRRLWQRRSRVIKITGVFVLIGISIAMLSRNEFTSSTIVVPQLSGQESKLGGLSSLASIAGFDLGSVSSGQNLSPKLYPQILRSESFSLELMHSEISLDTAQVSLYTYFQDIYEPSFFFQCKNLYNRPAWCNN